MNRALKRGHARLIVIVEAARAHGVEILRRAALPGRNESHVDLGTIRVGGVRIGIHLVGAAIVVDERNPRSWRDGHVLRRYAAGRDRNRGRDRTARATATGEGARENTVAYVSTPVWSSVIGPPDGPSVDGSWRVRSELIFCQVWPSLVDFQTCCEVA